jgi:hypothetical protein
MTNNVTFTTEIGPARAAPAFGQAGNSPYSDWEYPATIRFSDGITIKTVFSSREGAEYWARELAGDEAERKRWAALAKAEGR